MKQLFTLLLFCIAWQLSAQDLVVNPSDTIYGEYPFNEWTADYIYVQNEGEAPISVKYEMLVNTFPSGWTTNFCTHEHCYNYIPSSGSLGVINPGEEGYLTFSIGFWEVAATAECVVRIYKADEPSVADTVTVIYHVEDGLTAAKEQSNEFLFAVGPNPTTEMLTVESPELTNWEILIQDLSGKVLKRGETASGTWSVSLNGLPQGMYLLSVMSDEKVVHAQRIVKL